MSFWPRDTHCTLCGQVMDNWGGACRRVRHNPVGGSGKAGSLDTSVPNLGVPATKNPPSFTQMPTLQTSPKSPIARQTCGFTRAKRPGSLGLLRLKRLSLRPGSSWSDRSIQHLRLCEVCENLFVGTVTQFSQAGITLRTLVLEAVVDRRWSGRQLQDCARHVTLHWDNARRRATALTPASPIVAPTRGVLASVPAWHCGALRKDSPSRFKIASVARVILWEESKQKQFIAMLWDGPKRVPRVAIIVERAIDRVARIEHLATVLLRFFASRSRVLKAFFFHLFGSLGSSNQLAARGAW